MNDDINFEIVMQRTVSKVGFEDLIFLHVASMLYMQGVSQNDSQFQAPISLDLLIPAK